MHLVIFRRILNAIPLLLLSSFISFMFVRMAPGDPVAMYLARDVEDADPEVVAQIRERLGLDRPLLIQYASWLKLVLQGDLGYSIVSKRPVIQVIWDVLPNSLLLAAISLPLAVIIGLLIGVLTAVLQRSIFDYLVTAFVFIGYSLPSFYLALLLLYFFSFQMKWLPSSGMRSLRGSTHSPFVDLLLHAAMPVMTYTLVRLVVWVRFQRNSLIEVMNQDYIRTARAKGLHQRGVILKHAWRNSLIPIITQLGLSFSSLVGGSFIIESIFAWPGMGRMGLDSVRYRDFPVTMGILLISSIMIIIGNMISDISYALLDPRVRLDKAKR